MMKPASVLIGLLADLLQENERLEAVRALAEHFEAELVVLFLRDSEVDALLPAPGFLQTFPEGARWRNFLMQCLELGQFQTSLPCAQDKEMAAHGIAHGKESVLVFLGGKPDVDDTGLIHAITCLLGRALRSEQKALFAKAEVSAARESSTESRRLAEALDHARRDLELALRDTRLSHEEAKHEIAERVRIEEKLRQTAQELARSNTDLELFARTASHDLQEPLAKISSFIDLLSTTAKLNEKEQTYFSKIKEAAERMRRLIQDLLEYAHVSTSNQALEEVDLTKLAKQVVSDLEVKIRSTNAVVEIEQLPVVVANSFQMRQLFQNLIGNALKFSKANEPPRIFVQGSARKEGVVELVIQDNGIGFDEQYKDRIFRPFERLHGKGKFQGSGIGLAICERIVKGYDGTITAESKLDVGSRFTITLSVPGTSNRMDRAHVPSGGASC